MRELTEAEVRRIKRLPDMLDAARRKVTALEREAERHGMRDLLEQSHNIERAA